MASESCILPTPSLEASIIDLDRTLMHLDEAYLAIESHSSKNSLAQILADNEVQILNGNGTLSTGMKLKTCVRFTY